MIYYHCFQFRYIYYADVYCCIWRAKMDGSDPTKIISFSGGKVEDLAIHYESHTLYWTRNDLIYYASLDGAGPVATLNSSILKDSSPIGLSITNGTLYWTQQRRENVDGTIFSYYLGSAFSEILLNDDTLDPGDISSVLSKDVLKTSKLWMDRQMDKWIDRQMNVSIDRKWTILCDLY